MSIILDPVLTNFIPLDNVLADDEDLIPSAMIQEEASIEDVDAEVIRLRKVIADQNGTSQLTV